ncbi:hypothetical protein D3C83_306240 [compost metagenome]
MRISDAIFSARCYDDREFAFGIRLASVETLSSFIDDDLNVLKIFSRNSFHLPL